MVDRYGEQSGGREASCRVAQGYLSEEWFRGLGGVVILAVGHGCPAVESWVLRGLRSVGGIWVAEGCRLIPTFESGPSIR